MNTALHPLNDTEVHFARDLGLEIALFAESIKGKCDREQHARYWTAVQDDRPADALELFRNMCAAMDTTAPDQKRHVRSVRLAQSWGDLIDQHAAHLREFAWQFRLGWGHGLRIYERILS